MPPRQTQAIPTTNQQQTKTKAKWIGSGLKTLFFFWTEGKFIALKKEHDTKRQPSLKAGQWRESEQERKEKTEQGVKVRY